MPACCAYGCPNTREWDGKRGVTFHTFPKEASLRQQWIAALQRKDFAPTKSTQICSEHFEESVIDRTSLARVRLREGAVPTIFPASPPYIEYKVRKRKPPTNRMHFQNEPEPLPGPTIDMPPPAPDFFLALEASPDMATPKKKLLDTEGKLVFKRSITPATIDMPPHAPDFFPALELSPDMATLKRKFLDTEGKLVSKRSITPATINMSPSAPADFLPTLEASPDESTLKRKLLDAEEKLESSRKKIKTLLQTKRRLTKKISDLTTAINQQRKNEMISRKLWDDSHKYHQPALMMETMLDLDREVYNSWCNIGAALSLTTNSQIAQYLVDYFQKHELESKNCLTCGGALTLHCVFCSNKKSPQNDKFSTKESEEGQGQEQNERHAVKMVSSTRISYNVQSDHDYVANEATNSVSDQSINIENPSRENSVCLREMKLVQKQTEQKFRQQQEQELRNRRSILNTSLSDAYQSPNSLVKSSYDKSIEKLNLQENKQTLPKIIFVRKVTMPVTIPPLKSLLKNTKSVFLRAIDPLNKSVSVNTPVPLTKSITLSTSVPMSTPVPLTTSDLFTQAQYSVINQVSDTQAGSERLLHSKSNYKPKSLKLLPLNKKPSLISPKPVNTLGDKVTEVSCSGEKSCQESNTLSSPGLPKHCALVTNKKIVCRQTDSKQKNLQNKFNLVSHENLSSSIVPDNNQQEDPITAKIEDVGDYGKSDVASKQQPHQKLMPYCEICKKFFSTKHYLKIHKNNVHDRIKPFKCDICSRSFCQSQNLQLHKFSHVDATPHQCGICGKRFKTLIFLKRHAAVHSHSKNHICELCGTRFSISQNLHRHKLTVHYKIKRFACDICSKTFTRSANLQDHMIIHSSIPEKRRTYPKLKYAVCETCGKSFHQGYMKLHKMTHTGEKPHVCQVCGRGFIQYISYKEHMQSHNGVKPYVCKICNKSFAFSGSLTTHKMVHTNPEKFECEVCKKKFKYSCNLNRHKRSHVCENVTESF